MSLDSDGPRACRNRRRKSARLNFTEFAVLATPRFAPASRIRSILAPNDPADADPAVPGQTEIARSSGWARSLDMIVTRRYRHCHDVRAVYWTNQSPFA
jgi:hypothetical protein